MVAKDLGISRALVYRLASRYRLRAQTSSLLPFRRGRAPRSRLLNPEVEALICTVVERIYLQSERPRQRPFARRRDRVSTTRRFGLTTPGRDFTRTFVIRCLSSPLPHSSRVSQWQRSCNRTSRRCIVLIRSINASSSANFRWDSFLPAGRRPGAAVKTKKKFADFIQSEAGLTRALGRCRRPADRCAMDGLANGATLDRRRSRRDLRLWCYRQCLGDARAALRLGRVDDSSRLGCCRAVMPVLKTLCCHSGRRL